MDRIYNQDTHAGLVANVMVAFILFFSINAVVFGFHLTSYNDSINPSWAPPAWFIGIVWPILFLFNAVALWTLNCNPSRQASRWKALLFTVLLLNATHPIYTAGFRFYWMALLGTIIPFALCIYVIANAWPVRRVTSYLMLPMCLWFIYAGAIIVAVLAKQA